MLFPFNHLPPQPKLISDAYVPDGGFYSRGRYRCGTDKDGRGFYNRLAKRRKRKGYKIGRKNRSVDRDEQE